MKGPIRTPKVLRALCNGKTSAFQADDAGSIPAARSNPFHTNLNDDHASVWLVKVTGQNYVGVT